MTMLLVTHDTDVAAIAKRQIRLEEGKLVEVSGHVRKLDLVSA